MSIEAVKMAFNQEGLTNSEKHVLLHLAWHHNELSGDCAPTIVTLSKNTGITARHVPLVLRKLSDKGFISIVGSGKGVRRKFNLLFLKAKPTCDK